MIEEVRQLPPAMLTIGAVLLSAFIIVVTSMIAVVMAADPQSPPDLALLAIPPGVDIVGTHSICDVTVCDGQGVVLDPERSEAPQLMDRLERRLLENEWLPFVCDEGALCFTRDDLRVRVAPWAGLDDATGTAMQATLEDMDIDEHRLVYVALTRCSPRNPCP